MQQMFNCSKKEKANKMKNCIFVSIVLFSTLCFGGKEKRQSSYDTLDLLCREMRKELDIVQERSNDKYEGYIGCFKDDSSRHLKKYTGNPGNLAKCKKKCKGYKYLGLQNRAQCFCGNTLFKKQYPMVDDSECNYACTAEPNRKCGTAWRNSIYFV